MSNAQRFKLAVLAVLVLGGGALAARASATPPTTTSASFTGLVTPITAGALCPFAVQMTTTETFRSTTFYDANGLVSQRLTHGMEQDTFEANGQTLAGDAYSFNFHADFVDGVRVAVHSDGFAERVHLPGGGVLVIAGRGDTLGSPGPIFFVDSGNHGATLDAFCAALS